MPTKTPPKSKPAAASAEVRAPAPDVESRPSVSGSVKLDEIKPCPFNVRRTFDADDIAGLAESIRASGLKEPLLVRPMPKAGGVVHLGRQGWMADIDHLQLVDGERRYRALKLLAKKQPDATVSIIVRDYTDDEVRAIMLVSREQSRDLSVSELVAGYTELRAKLPDDAACAARVGQMVGHVRSILRLGKLPAWALAAVDTGALPRATAERVAAIGGPESRKRAAACVLLGLLNPADLDQDWNDGDTWEEAASRFLDLHSHEPDSRDCLSYRDTRDLIANHFQKQLKGCPFDRKSLDLLPAAGSCEACPQLAGNDPETVAEGTRADVCLDPDCYREKLEAHDAKEVAKGIAKGALEPPEDFEWSHPDAPPRGWSRIDVPTGQTELATDFVGNLKQGGHKRQEETLTALLDLHTERGVFKYPSRQGPAIYAVLDNKHKLRLLVKTADARRTLQASGVLKKPERAKAPSTNAGSESSGAATKSQNSAKAAGPSLIAVEDQVGLVAGERCRTILLANAESLKEMSANGGPDTDAVYQALAFSARVLVRDWLIYGDVRRDAVERYVPATADVEIRDKKITLADKAIDGMTPAEVVGLILALCTHVAQSDGNRTSFADVYQELIDYADTTAADIESQARKELQRAEYEPGGLHEGEPLPPELAGEPVAEPQIPLVGSTPIAEKVPDSVTVEAPTPIIATTCVKCKATFDSARKKCPSCNWVQPAEPKAADDTLDKGLLRALFHVQGAAARWDRFQQSGATDAQIKERLGEELGGAGVGYMGGPDEANIHYKGGANPCFWYDSPDSAPPKTKPTLAGVALINAVRKLLQITQPKAAVNTPPAPPDGVSSTALYLRLIPGFPVDAANELQRVSVRTVADLKRRVDEQDKALDADGRLYAAIRGTPGIDATLARQAMDAVTAYPGWAQAVKTPAEQAANGKPAKAKKKVGVK